MPGGESIFMYLFTEALFMVLSPMVDVKHSSEPARNVSVLVDVDRGNWVCKGLEGVKEHSWSQGGIR